MAKKSLRTWGLSRHGKRGTGEQRSDGATIPKPSRWEWVSLVLKIIAAIIALLTAVAGLVKALQEVGIL